MTEHSTTNIMLLGWRNLYYILGACRATREKINTLYHFGIEIPFYFIFIWNVCKCKEEVTKKTLYVENARHSTIQIQFVILFEDLLPELFNNIQLQLSYLYSYKC